MTIFASRAEGGGAGSAASKALGAHALSLVVLGVAATAWVVVVSTHSTSLDHHGLGDLWERHSDSPAASGHTHASGHGSDVGIDGARGQVLAIVAGWGVMILAMMLPPALPMLQMLRKLVVRRRGPRLLVGLGGLSFVAVWTVVGMALIAGDSALHAVSAGQEWLTRAPYRVTGAVLMVAGAYQFSPLKNICLRACRSPRSFALAHWRGRRSAATEVSVLSGAYALSCVGCCWALMTISFAVGAVALPVMVVLALFMAAERLVGWGRHLVRPAGLALLVIGLVTVLGHGPTGLVAG